MIGLQDSRGGLLSCQGFVALVVPMVLGACSGHADDCFTLYYCDDQVSSATFQVGDGSNDTFIQKPLSPSCYFSRSSAGSWFLQIAGSVQLEAGTLSDECVASGQSDEVGCQLIRIKAVAEFPPDTMETEIVGNGGLLFNAARLIEATPELPYHQYVLVQGVASLSRAESLTSSTFSFEFSVDDAWANIFQSWGISLDPIFLAGTCTCTLSSEYVCPQT
jgi:hypothetical protein